MRQVRWDALKWTHKSKKPTKITWWASLYN